MNRKLRRAPLPILIMSIRFTTLQTGGRSERSSVIVGPPPRALFPNLKAQGGPRHSGSKWRTRAGRRPLFSPRRVILGPYLMSSRPGVPWIAIPLLLLVYRITFGGGWERMG